MFFTIFICLSVFVAAVNGPIVEKNAGDSVYLTWMSNTNWLVEVGNIKILMDGWITRIPRVKRFAEISQESLSVPPVKPDAKAVRRILVALDIDDKLDYIISGHSHFDHSFDTAVWAKLTGANIIGPRSSCLQAMAQGIPKSRCTMVDGGEILDLGGGLQVRVICWNHTGDPSTPLGLFLQTPMELIDVPKLDPETGGLLPGLLDHFPHGGIRAYLFTLQTKKGKITWLYSNSGNSLTFEKPAAIDEAFLKKYKLTLHNLVITPQKKSVKEHLVAAKTAAGLEGVDLWLGYGSSAQVKQVTAILRPKAFIPHHWGGLWSDFFKGPNRAYSNPKLKEYLAGENIRFLVQRQYMDKYKMDVDGIQQVPNRRVKERLGFK